MPLLKHTAGSAGSRNITALNPNSCPSQEPDCPGILPSLPPGQGLQQLRAWPAPIHPNLLRARAWRWGGGCKAAPSEVPPAQSFSPGFNQGAGLGGGYLTQRNSFKSSKFKARAIGSVSLRQSQSSGQQGSQNLEGKRWGSAAPAVLLQSSACLSLSVGFRPGSPAGERDKAAPKSTTSIRRATAASPACTGGFGVPHPP